MKGMFIINPSSGTQTIQRRAVVIMERLLKDKDCDGIFTMYTHKKDDARLAAKALRPGEYDYVVAVGGDGTVNEVASGLYESGSGIPMAVIAAGTVNDFANSVGLPKDITNFCGMIRAMRTVPMDLGVMNGEYFYNDSAGGALSEVAHTTDPDLKTAFGRLAYLAEGVKKFGNINLRTQPLVFVMDGVTEKFDTFYYTLSNSKSVGGFQKTAPDARINDGKMDLIIVKKIEPAEVLPFFTQFQNGQHINNKKLCEYRQVKTLRVYSEDENAWFSLDHDGEAAGNIPVDVEVIPNAIRLVVPEQSAKLDRITV